VLHHVKHVVLRGVAHPPTPDAAGADTSLQVCSSPYPTASLLAGVFAAPPPVSGGEESRATTRSAPADRGDDGDAPPLTAAEFVTVLATALDGGTAARWMRPLWCVRVVYARTAPSSSDREGVCGAPPLCAVVVRNCLAAGVSRSFAKNDPWNACLQAAGMTLVGKQLFVRHASCAVCDVLHSTCRLLLLLLCPWCLSCSSVAYLQRLPVLATLLAQPFAKLSECALQLAVVCRQLDRLRALGHSHDDATAAAWRAALSVTFHFLALTLVDVLQLRRQTTACVAPASTATHAGMCRAPHAWASRTFFCRSVSVDARNTVGVAPAARSADAGVAAGHGGVGVGDSDVMEAETWLSPACVRGLRPCIRSLLVRCWHPTTRQLVHSQSTHTATRLRVRDRPFVPSRAA
jgi:hypothetical protein